MKVSIVTQEDLNFFAQQSTGKLNLILAGMVAFIYDDMDNASIKNQTWFQRIAKTIIGKNKMSEEEIEIHQSEISQYILETMFVLYDQKHIDYQIMIGLANQLREFYIDNLLMKQMLGTFIYKLNQKIESVDNFEILNTAIKKGEYSRDSNIFAICKILAQMDNSCIQDTKKVEIIQKGMIEKGILNDNEYTLATYLQQIMEISVDEIGIIYMELYAIRDNIIAAIMLQTIENYHFLSDMDRKLKNTKAIIEEIISEEELDPTITLTINDIYQALFNSKIDMVDDLVTIEEIQQEAKIQEAECLFLDYKLDDAFEIFKTLAENGNGRAMYFLGMYYQYGHGKIKEDEELAKEWQIKGAKAGDVLATISAQYSLQKPSQKRVQTHEVLVDRVEEMAQIGDVFAIETAARLLYDGYDFYLEGFDEGVLGANPRRERAIEMYKKGAEQGNWFCAHMLLCYEMYEEVIEASQKEAIRGSVIYQFYLGLAYVYIYRITDVEKNIILAIEWLEKAARQNFAIAQDLMADFYHHGTGVEKNDNLAFNWCKKAAEQGLPDAQNMLACYYDDGIGTKKDVNLAFKWYKKAAENGSDVGQSNLAMCYKYGDGTSQNLNLAKKWAMKAAEQGNETAIENLKEWFGIIY